jgi:solute carrier family 39 (zinc transporter), member 1/2/3
MVGITLAVSEDFIPLFLVLTVHQLFEGLGLGTRLADLAIFTSPRTKAQAPARGTEEDDSSMSKRKALSVTRPSKGYRLFPWFGALAFAFTMPLGVVIGLGVRHSYDSNSSTANIVSGIFDAFRVGFCSTAGSSSYWLMSFYSTEPCLKLH